MLNDFEVYISKKIGLKEKYIPYYARWVDNCYRFFKKDKNKPLSGKLQRKILKYLSETHDDLYSCPEKECPLRKKSAGLLILCYFFRTGNEVTSTFELLARELRVISQKQEIIDGIFIL